MAINKNIVQVLIEQQTGKKVVITSAFQDVLVPTLYSIITQDNEEFEFNALSGQVKAITLKKKEEEKPVVISKQSQSIFNASVDELDEDDEEEIRKYLEEEKYLPNTGTELEVKEVKETPIVVEKVVTKKKRKKRAKNGTGPLNKKHQVDYLVNSKEIKPILESMIGFELGGYLVLPKTPGPYRAISVVNKNGTEYIVKFYFESKLKD